MTTLEALSPTLITTYLTPNVQYDHLALKQAYYAACNDFVGTQLRLDVMEAYAHGSVEMTHDHLYSDHRNFFEAVIAAHPADHPDFRLVPGCLVMWGE